MRQPKTSHPFNSILYLSSIIFLLSVSSCGQKRHIDFPRTDLTSANLIPKPLEILATNSGFALDEYTAIRVDENAPGFKEVGDFLADKIKAKTKLSLPVGSGSATKSTIEIYQSKLESDNPEAYQLTITQDAIQLTANTATGAFRGVQTIRQLIPESANDTLAVNEIWVVPTGEIIDTPQFAYRSTMLDVSRHFFDAEYVKKYIGLLSYYKINVLHLHLTDDQGWRIEIKSWPKLTEVGGSTEVDGGDGGFYTQEEYKEIVAFAAAHHMMIVPEVDMPGHTNAASASYPVLNGNGKTPELYTGRKVGFSTFDTKKDTVYKFIDDVVREIASMSPGPYFHIGGDESHVTGDADYISFVNRVEKIVQKHGKQLIGWDEVLNADLDASTSVAQVWRPGASEVKELVVNKGMKVILSPANKAYLDMKYDTLTEVGYAWAGYIPVDTAYNWSLEAYAPLENILGIDAPLWSETIDKPDELEYLAFPRVIGYAEIGWTNHEQRNWEDYKKRLANQAYFLERMKVNYYPASSINWSTKKPRLALD